MIEQDEHIDRIINNRIVKISRDDKSKVIRDVGRQRRLKKTKKKHLMT